MLCSYDFTNYIIVFYMQVYVYLQHLVSIWPLVMEIDLPQNGNLCWNMPMFKPPGIPAIKLNFFRIILKECLINTLTTRHDEFLSLQIFLQLKDIGYRVKWGIFPGIYYLKPRKWPGSHCMQNDDGINALGEKRLSILFVLHEEIFCLKEVVVEVNVVGLNVPITTLR